MKSKLIVLAILVLLCIAAPFLLTGFWVRLITFTFMFAVLASALNIIAGFTGYAAFGNMIFFGLGAYTTAVLMTRVGFSYPPALICSAAVAVAVAIVLGLLLLRLKGHYFALGTLGAAEAMKYIVENMTEITGGGQGITVPPLRGSPVMINTFFYFMMFGLLIIILIVVWRLSKNRLGYAFKAIRANEEAAGVMGIDTTRYKITAWALSALFTGITGSVYAYWFTYIDAPTVFDVMWVVKMFVILLIGGAGTIFGPVIGAFILETISELVWSRFINLHLGILGLIIILVVLFMPRGIISLVTQGKGIRDLVPVRRKGAKR
ncbi:MAG: branched-chain amino acid ABC transporter permease [Spirochaetaceae bacterium]|nr:MAG: branched-chain amino acid ABC transporter permease [Spirochaetaceae bacterium]